MGEIRVGSGIELLGGLTGDCGQVGRGGLGELAGLGIGRIVVGKSMSM